MICPDCGLKSWIGHGGVKSHLIGKNRVSPICPARLFQVISMQNLAESQETPHHLACLSNVGKSCNCINIQVYNDILAAWRKVNKDPNATMSPDLMSELHAVVMKHREEEKKRS